jgi:septal ring factor EnvC (AmiA/AmiB activator)
MSDYDDDDDNELPIDSSYQGFGDYTTWMMDCPHCCNHHEIWEKNELWYCPCTPMHKTGFPCNIMECLSSEPGKVMSRFPKMSAIIKYKLQQVLPEIIEEFENERQNKRAEKASRKSSRKEAISDLESRIDFLEAQVQEMLQENYELRMQNDELQNSINTLGSNVQSANIAAIRSANYLRNIDNDINFMAGRMG